jgi:hypothetical protein
MTGVLDTDTSGADRVEVGRMRADGRCSFGAVPCPYFNLADFLGKAGSPARVNLTVRHAQGELAALWGLEGDWTNNHLPR